jgi:hypothetical protein
MNGSHVYHATLNYGIAVNVEGHPHAFAAGHTSHTPRALTSVSQPKRFSCVFILNFRVKCKY